MRAAGMLQGAAEGLKLARQSFITGEPIDGQTKIDTHRVRAIGGRTGDILRLPTRALTAEDEFFKSVAYRGEISVLAAREAFARGRSEEGRARLFDDLRDNPTEAMVDAALKHADRQTFQQPLGPFGQSAQNFLNKGPMKLFIPFSKTPINLLKWAGERSPLAPTMKEWRDDVRAGGQRRDTAVAKVTMGSGLAAVAAMAAAKGILSGGGPSDPREREALQNTGWQPYSVKVGGTWYSYQRFDPFARLISTAADFATLSDHMTDDERDNYARTVGMAVARNIASMPLLDPAQNLFEALSDPDRALERYAKNLAAAVAVPQLVAQINSVTDPYLRETDSIADAVKARIPGLSETLPARVTQWGEPMKRKEALGPDILSSVTESPDKNDATLSEVARLEVGLSRPDGRIGGQRIIPGDRDTLTAMGGQPAKQMLDEMIASPSYQDLPDGMRRRLIKSVVSEFREDAKKELLTERPDLLEAEMMGRMKRKSGER